MIGYVPILLSSVYVFSKSLDSINQSFLEDKKPPNPFFVVNGFICVVSGSVFLYTIGFVSYLSIEYNRRISR
jgi:hypothetical protein